MARKDWLTGQSLEREGPNPIAGFLSGLMQAQAGKQQQADAERREQQKQAMMQIQDGRTMLEKAAQLDPTLWADTGFMGAWQAGQVDYLAKSGWKPPVKEQAVDYEKATKQAAWKAYQEGTATDEQKKFIGVLKDEDPYEKYHEGDVVRDKRTGKIVFQVPKTYNPDSPGGGVPKPQKTRWATRQIVMGDGKSHLIQYDIDDAKNRDKWVDLGVAGSVTANKPTFTERLDFYGKLGGQPVPEEEPDLDDEDTLFIGELAKLLNP